MRELVDEVAVGQQLDLDRLAVLEEKLERAHVGPHEAVHEYQVHVQADGVGRTDPVAHGWFGRRSVDYPVFLYRVKITSDDGYIYAHPSRAHPPTMRMATRTAKPSRGAPLNNSCGQLMALVAKLRITALDGSITGLSRYTNPKALLWAIVARLLGAKVVAPH